MTESEDGWRQAVVTFIAFFHICIQLVVFFVYVRDDFDYDKMTRGIMLTLCVAEVVTSLLLMKGAAQKKTNLFVPWLFTTFILVVTMIIYILKVCKFETTILLLSAVVFSSCTWIAVYRIGAWFFESSNSQDDTVDGYPLNMDTMTEIPFDITESYSLTDEENRATATPVVVRESTVLSPNSTAHDTIERLHLSSRHNRPTAPPIDVPQSAALNHTPNMTDDPPAYDEAVSKVPYAVTGPVAAANPPYPLTEPVGMPNLPYSAANSVAACNPPYPMEDPIGAPTPQHSVAGPSDISIVGWRTDLFPDNAKK